MLVHPIFLYLGYVGLTIPFAFAIGSLLARRTDERWIVATRRATLVAWTALGVGQLIGAKWAYEEVGWGGYYAWDPVENAALMPWLAATAFLHSVMVQEKRGMLRLWNVLLVILAFSLSIFGTFLTRSGILSSVHSFTESPIGAWFLGFLAFVVVGSLALVFARLPLLRTRARLESLVSREATFLYNNLLLVALTLTILWGVAYPIVHEVFLGETRIVGPRLLQLLLRDLRAAAAPADGDRAARRLAARLAPEPRPDVRLAGGCRRRNGPRPARAGRGIVHPRTDRLQLLRVRARVDRARVRAWHAGAPALCPAARGRPRSAPSSRGTGADTAATSSTRRSSCSRSGSQAQASTTRLERRA